MKHGGRERRRRADDAYTAGNTYLLTACTRDRQPRFVEPELARAVCVIIEAVSIEVDQRLWAYCVMPDHVHLLTSGADPRVGMRLIKGRVGALAEGGTRRCRHWLRSALLPKDPAPSAPTPSGH